MKKLTLVAITSLFCLSLIANVAFSGEVDHSGHNHGASGPSSTGDMINSSTVEGFKLMHHLIDMSAHVKDMPEMKGTNHLMVYITAPHGHGVSQAKVGYVVTGPDKSKQKVMAMSMSGGFGADVKFKNKGTYLITTKALVEGKKLIDHFTYKLK